MDEHVFEVQDLPVVVTGNILTEAIAQLLEDKRDVTRLPYFLDMNDRKISEWSNVVHQTISKRRLTTLKELCEYLMKEGFEEHGEQIILHHLPLFSPILRRFQNLNCYLALAKI